LDYIVLAAFVIEAMQSMNSGNGGLSITAPQSHVRSSENSEAVPLILKDGFNASLQIWNIAVD